MPTKAALVEIEEVPFGIRKTLEQMEKLSIRGARDPFVIMNAMRLVNALGIPRKAYLKEIEALLQYAQGIHPEFGGLRYARDPREVMESPRMTEEYGHGDASDLAVWLAAHLLAIGHGPVRFVAISAKDRPDDFVHVYLHYGNPEGKRFRWIALDPTVEEPMGWEYPDAAKKVYYDVGKQ